MILLYERDSNSDFLYDEKYYILIFNKSKDIIFFLEKITF